VRFLDSYIPVAGDSVWVLQNDSDYLIIGRLGVSGTAVSGGRIATTVATGDSSTFTTEAVIDTVVAPLVIGRTYRVRWMTHMLTATNSANIIIRIREDSLTGTGVQSGMVQLPLLSRAIESLIEGEYTAAATGDKTFVGTAVRDSGTGTCNAEGAADRPRFLYVDYIRG
jgi:hypothetical protein